MKESSEIVKGISEGNLSKAKDLIKRQLSERAHMTLEETKAAYVFEKECECDDEEE